LVAGKNAIKKFMTTWSNKIISYNKKLGFSGTLPKGIRIMNPYQTDIVAFMTTFTTIKKPGKSGLFL
jgi:hypothetical protein